MASEENQLALDLLDGSIPFRERSEDVLKAIKTIQKAIDDLELYKKALEINCRDRAFCDIDQHSTQDFMDLYIAKAKEELENGK